MQKRRRHAGTFKATKNEGGDDMLRKLYLRWATWRAEMRKKRRWAAYFKSGGVIR
jgi:hypothetical protein